jgi:hypothetical protein
MAGKRIEIDLPEELAAQLARVAEAMGIVSLEETAMIAVAEWTSRRAAELDDRDPNQKYFINEALDELNSKK